MPATKLEQFGGMLPAWDDRLLPDNQAALTVNAYLFSGSLIGWRKPKLLRTLTNPSAQAAYRVPTLTATSAHAYLLFNSNPHAGDTVQVGDEVYTFVAAVANPYDVLIGGAASNSATNLFEALTLTGTAGVTYGSGTVANPDIDQTGTATQGTINFGVGTQAYIFVQAPSFGASYNTTPVLESTAHVRMAWLFDLVANTDFTTTMVGGTNQTEDTTITGAATWLEFLDPDTNVVRSPVVDDTFQRYYFASPSLPPQYNTAARIAAGQAPYLLGVPAPGCAPGVTATGGGNTEQFGFPTSSTSGTYTSGANSLYLIPFTPDGAVTLQDIGIMPGSGASATATWTGVLFADNGGKPGDLLNVAQSVQGAVAGVPLYSPFANPTGLLFNVQYWIGYVTDTASPIAKANTGTTGQVNNTNIGVNVAPIFAPVMTPGQANAQVWADCITESVTESRAYVYTWQTAYGEEGPPSPPTLVDSWTNATWTIQLFSPQPDQIGPNGSSRNITLTNIYRAITGSGGTTTYFFVAQVPVTQLSYADTVSDQTVALNNELESSLWFPPPANLQGIMAMPNGMTVGFVSNQIWFSEAYRPHAWPPSYVLTTEFPIIGLGVVGQTVVACTASKAVTATGVAPSSMALNKVDIPEPCVSRGSIISTPSGVYYTSLNGLIFVDPSGNGSNITAQWITRERWRGLTPAKNIRAIPYSSTYFAFGCVNGADVSVAQQGYTVELAADDAKSFTIWPQAGGHRLGFGQMTSPLLNNMVNLWVDPWNGYALSIQNGGVYYYDFADQSPAITPFKWRSKKFQQHSKHSYEAMRIWFDVPPGTPAQNATRDTNNPQPVFPDVAGQYGIVRVYADDVLTTTREIRTSGELLRLLSGFKSQTWQIEIEGIINIKNVEFATSVRELMTV